MTAYGRGECQVNDSRFTAEIRSLNNRHREIILRIPASLQSLDRDLKSIISSRIRRGRVEVTIKVEKFGQENPYSLEINTPLVNAYMEIFDQLSKQFDLEKKIGVETFCQMNDIILYKTEEVDMEKVIPGLHKVLNQALDSLDEMKIKEGQAIEADFRGRLGLLDKHVNDIRARIPHQLEEYRNRLEENVKRFLQDVDVDETRIAQEVALFAERSDITEEAVRIRSHLNQFEEYLALDKALGRRLDFLIQEINREVNTVGAKASDSFISRTVVEMKAELEKLREQVQNVE